MCLLRQLREMIAQAFDVRKTADRSAFGSTEVKMSLKEARRIRAGMRYTARFTLKV